MHDIDKSIAPKQLVPAAERVFQLGAAKARSIDRAWDTDRGTPVFTVGGKYTTRGWTEWTQGFVYGCMILAGDALGDAALLQLGRRRTVERMLPHVTHTGVHDHGFNNLSTYGNLLRLMAEGRLEQNAWEETTYRQAIAASGAVQAARWAGTPPTGSPQTAQSPTLGYIYSFNGPHSLFIDTMRTTRILGVAWKLGHALMHEGDRKADLLKRSVLHGLTTNHYIVMHGRPEDQPKSARAAYAALPYADSPFNVRGRTAHEGTFNRNDGAFRARATQQGYSPFSTWTRGLAWAMCGYAEELEFLDTIDAKAFKESTGLAKSAAVKVYEQAARETCDHYLCEASAADGITYWDDGAPGLAHMPDWRDHPADPYNDHEPVDSTASAIAAQGLIRLGNYLIASGSARKGEPYLKAGLGIARVLFDEPYLSTKRSHQGLLLHSIYHQPNGWDHTPAGRSVPCDESSMWGDYHLLELANLIARMAQPRKYGPYPTFFAGA
ncbi:MAG: glycosyl hydrolase [Planctomycetota bacterium]